MKVTGHASVAMVNAYDKTSQEANAVDIEICAQLIEGNPNFPRFGRGLPVNLSVHYADR